MDRHRARLHGYCFGLPGVISQGDTVEELLANLEEALALWLKTD